MSGMASEAVEATLARVDEAGSLSDAELVRLLAQVEEVGRRIDAARVRLAGEVAHRSRRELGRERLSARLGCRTPGEAIQRVTGIAGVSAGRRIRLGLATRGEVGLTGAALPARFEQVADGLRSGMLGLDAAHAIVTTLDPTLRVADATDVAAAEHELVAAATEHWGSGSADADDADPDGADADGAGPDGTDPDGAEQDGAEGADADGADPDGADADGAHADGADPDGADADGAHADGADPDGADPDGGDAGPRSRGGAPVIDADAVRLQARVWAEFLDPDGGAPDERDEERRFLTLRRPRHGLVPVSGLLLPQVAAALRTYADAWTNPKTDPAPAPTSGPWSGQTDPSDPSDPVGPTGLADPSDRTDQTDPSDSSGPVVAETRSRAQVMHDVLATALNVAARVVDAPSVAGHAPTLVVVAREDDLVTGTGVACTEDGTVVSIAAARHVACAGAIQRVGVDGSGRVVGLWSAQRCFTGAQRRAIAVRDGGCVIPGCHVPAAWCEVHHVVPHADDPGGTTTDNGVLLCWHHHRTIDTSGWQIRMLDGLPWISPPSWLDRTGRWRPANPPVRPSTAAEQARRSAG